MSKSVANKSYRSETDTYIFVQAEFPGMVFWVFSIFISRGLLRHSIILVLHAVICKCQ